MMKKVFLVSFLACVILVLDNHQLKAQAQSQSWQYGIKAGLNYSGYRRNSDLAIGYQFGGFTKKYLGEFGWFLEPGLIYSLEGNILKRLEYLYIPLVFGFDLDETFNINVGFQYGYFLGTRATYEEENIETGNPVINLGMDFYLARSIIGFKVNYGLTPVDKNVRSSKTLNFQVHYQFLIKK